MLADGGDCLADLGAVRDQQPLFGAVASDSTAFRAVAAIAREPGLLEGLRAAHARARGRAWKLGLRPERVTIDLDATLITAHSDKDGAAGNIKGGFGSHPLLAYLDETDEALAGELRPGNAGANTAADQIAVCEAALEQIPAEHVETIDVLVRVDSAGATHDLLDWCRAGRIRYSVGFDLTEPIRAAILALQERSWLPALRADDEPREGAEVAEITHLVERGDWPTGSRLIVRRERPHPGAQLSFTDHDGHRFQCFITDQDGHDLAALELRHREHDVVEDRVRALKNMGLQNLPFSAFAPNQAWLEPRSSRTT